MKTIKEEILLFLIGNKSKKLKKRELDRYFNLPPGEKKVYYQAMKQLQREKIITVTKRNNVLVNKENSMIVGKFYYNPKGYGFLVSASNKKDVYFISREHISNALHEDIVVATPLIKEQAKKMEAHIDKVLEREVETVIGTYMDNDGYGFVVPDNQKINMDIYIPEGLANGAKSYDKVVCRIIKYPERNRKPEGEIQEVIGFKFERGVDLLSVIKEHNLRDEFPMKVIKQVEKMPGQIEEEEFRRRRDLRDLTIFTIDGEDSKDLDDAVSIKRLANGHYQLGVHIADVSHYVKENSKVDKEALERGVSVYLVDTVIPMLPTKLSNDLCSLNPNEDKLTLSVFMEINEQGQVVAHEIVESIIRSRAKLNYRELNDFLMEKDASFAQRHPDLVSDIKVMEELTYILMNKRDERGNIDFDFPEAKINLNADGTVQDIKKYDRGIANQLIEEFMIVCNETVSESFFNKALPFLYRTHQNPREEKIKEFAEYISQYGYTLDNLEDIEPKQLQQILKEVKGKKEEPAFHLLLLQCMQQARYTAVCKGHFGLATQFYSHFTSPIRRYPDLQIHRIIKEYLHGLLTPERKDALSEIVEANAKLCSKRERVAEKAEEALFEMKKVEFMEKKIGERFSGMISHVMASGFFVTLENTIEGFVHIHGIKEDDFEFVKSEHAFVGKKTGKQFTLGDRVSVEVEKVKVETKEILFRVV
ncbi:ribonuclease R (plasmid) [Aneurinibacillus sp. Ricciae_BoGa-3]|uniref:ribonuclease R n=1 Tax=Aneurinibacillus sp. Ricciae_BoGa-3 TaxID=3022697 RepID=UPI002341FEA2|nr:ribonuclease R [Aneurinibacillus sp. Ricciae_BoGa-3]WCK57043.1 ribonuclease R [Aneurinibacillus sp. Ricciae_BoGa-3]